METNNIIKRPIIRYLGGKFRIAPWVISFFPEHKTYVECFGGGASVLLRKAYSKTEVYNEINPRIANLFRVLKDEELALELRRQIRYTPFSRTELYDIYDDQECSDPVELARRTIIASHMSSGASGAFSDKCRGFHSTPNGNLGRSYQTYRSSMEKYTERLKNVIIENQDALEVIKKYDHEDTFFYCDPPYMPETWRKSMIKTAYGGNSYMEDMHVRLLTYLRNISGSSIVSGYDNELYNDILYDWKKESKHTINQHGDARTEVLWIDPKCFKGNALEKFI